MKFVKKGVMKFVKKGGFLNVVPLRFTITIL